jgi:aryl-alcohol dehydrogenase-like predicted oxidoreductase
MEYRNLGNSGLKVPVLSLGTATFDAAEASRLIDISLERGIDFFDTANVYSAGASESVLGKALKNRRHKAIISTKATFAMGEGANEKGSSRYHLTKALDDSLKRLETDYIDLYFMHGFDTGTPIEETLSTLDAMVKTGKVRYIGASNFAAWQLMKSLSVSEKRSWEKYIIYQGYYSLIGRDYEQELMPLIKDQGLGLMVWSPLGWGRLTGKLKKDGTAGEGRIQSGGSVGGPPVDDEYLYNVLDTLKEIAEETGKSIPQIAINWLTQNSTVSNIVIGARNEKQLLENIGSVDWKLSYEQVEKLNKVSHIEPVYPHWVGER